MKDASAADSRRCPNVATPAQDIVAIGCPGLWYREQGSSYESLMAEYTF